MARRRSTAVRLTVVPVLAAAFLAGCGEEEEETAYCVDGTDTVVENQNCDREYDQGGGGGGGFFWFFAGAGLGRGFGPGSRVGGLQGDRVRASDRSALARRGGFGSRARSGGVGRGTGSPGAGGFGGRSGGG